MLQTGFVFFRRMTVLLLIFGMQGCLHEMLLTQDRPISLHEADLQTLRSAHEAFQKGEFGKAAKKFESLSQEAEDRDVRHRALYALACARLILSENPDTFKTSLSLWETWGGDVAPDSETEDPRMLTPLLQQMVLLKAMEKENRRLKTRMGYLKRENLRLNEQIETLETIHQDIQEKKKGIFLHKGEVGE
ncbi:MAG: hypothetical protein B6245_06780 [Desulfobacteraceae bacterium 4572_88]|nr:MAG: hypothetical protein B6245_06780 [Desulfobacteraceae bacterium 4572_88]